MSDSCRKCGKAVVVEALDEKRTRVRCTNPACGVSEIRDERGAPLLTGDVRTSSRTLLG